MVSPFVEARWLERRPRAPLLLAAVLLVLVPYWILAPGSQAGLLLRVAAVPMLACAALILGLALARPRERIEIDAGGVVRERTGEVPRPWPQRTAWRRDDVTGTEIEEALRASARAFTPVLRLRGGDVLRLQSWSDRELAQDTVDHLVLLGYPGRSRADARAERLRGALPAIEPVAAHPPRPADGPPGEDPPGDATAAQTGR